MAYPAVPAFTRPAPAPPFSQLQSARHGLQEVRRQAAEDERRRLARELHDSVIQQVLAAGLTIDWCLAEVPAGSPVHAKPEHAMRLTGIAVRRLRSSLPTLAEGPRPAGEDLPAMLPPPLALPLA